MDRSHAPGVRHPHPDRPAHRRDAHPLPLSPYAHEQVINVPPDKTAKSAVNQKGSQRNMFFACREAAANHEIYDYRKRIRQLESEIDYRRTVIEALQSQIDKLKAIHE